jgi:hypothetical protein
MLLTSAGNLDDLASHVTGPAHQAARRMTAAARRISVHADTFSALSHTHEVILAGCQVLARYRALDRDAVMDRPGPDGITPRQHHVHALTVMADRLEAGAWTLAEARARTATAAAASTTARYRDGWEPGPDTDSTPPSPPPVPIDQPEQLPTVVLLAFCAVAAVALVALLSLLSSCQQDPAPDGWHRSAATISTTGGPR